MIIGDPDRFAIIIEFIPNWNIDNSWHNGIILFSINGKILFEDIRTSTLDVDLPEFIDNIKRLENKLPTNTDIYRMEKSSAFIQMYNISYPSDINIPNDYTYRISTTQLEDDNYYIFAVADHDNIRILGGRLETLSMKHSEIIEVTISKSYLFHFLNEEFWKESSKETLKRLEEENKHPIN